jgi:chromosome segregation ATPase
MSTPHERDAVARLTAARHAAGDRKLAQVRTALEQFERDGASFSNSELARAANVSRRFLYDHQDLLAAADAVRLRISAARAAGTGASSAVTAASLRADLENTKAQNTRLRNQLAAAEARLGELLGAEAAAEVGWTPPDVQRRMDEYAEQHARDQARIRELEEELEQVRRLNRELTAQANRPKRPSSPR